MAGTSSTIFLPDDANPDTYASIAYRDPNDPRRLSTSLRSQPYAVTSAISAGSQGIHWEPLDSRGMNALTPSRSSLGDFVQAIS